MKRTIRPVSTALFLLLTVGVGVLLFLNRDIDPPNTADLVHPRAQVADGGNAFTHFRAAAAALDWPKEKDQEELLVAILDDEKNDPEYLAEFLARNEKVFPLLEKGLACSICQAPPVCHFNDPEEIMEWRGLARLFALKSIRQREKGQFTDAVNTCGQLIRLGSLLEGEPESGVHFLVGMAVLRMGLREARRLAACQEIAPNALAALSDRLAQVGSIDDDVIEAFKAEFRIQASMIDKGFVNAPDGDGSDADKPRGTNIPYLLQPNRTKQMTADLFRTAIENARKNAADVKFPDVDEQLGLESGNPTVKYGPNTIGKVFLALLFPAEEAILSAKHMTKGELAATRAVVACRRHEADHGELPPTLDALTPEYLDAAPIDPFDGKPVRYDHERGVVYVVGKDLIDGGGSEKSLTGSDLEDERDQLWRVEDAVFYIHGRPTKPLPPDEGSDSQETSDRESGKDESQKRGIGGQDLEKQPSGQSH
jgi:hypothetical protein